MGFIWWALPVELRRAGVTPEAITALLAVVVLPWALKFLWAPAIDVLRSPRFSVRSWVITAQVAMSVALVPLVFLDLRESFAWVTAVLVVHSVAAATQDAAIDTLAIGSVPLHERGSVNGWMQVGMLGARAVFGGGAILAFGLIGHRGVVVSLIVSILVMAVLVRACVGRDVLSERAAGADRWRELVAELRRAFGQARTWVALVFATTAGAGFKSLTAIASVFLADRGVGREVIGSFFLGPAVIAMAVGAWFGGRVADRLPRRAAVAAFEALAATLVAVIGLVTLLIPAGTGQGSLLVLIVALYVSIGLATAAVYALFMDLTSPGLAATQFCAFMAGINLCEAWSTRTLGALLPHVGYGGGFMIMALPSLLSLGLLAFLKGSHGSHRP